MKLLVTGGRSEIGQEIIQQRLQKGDEVFYTTTERESSNESELKNLDQATRLSFDLRKPSPSLKWSEVISGGIDALILNAATPSKSYRCLADYTSEECHDFLDGNIYGNLWLVQQVLPSMIKNKFGRIVLISSQAVNGFYKHGLYAMYKAALEAMIKSLAMDYGEFGITANIIRPGIVKTQRTARFWKRSSYVEKMSPLIPMKKFALPSDIAAATHYFLHRDCYSTGTILNVSGGLPQVRTDTLCERAFAD